MEIGIDEAGKGSVIGPLIIAGIRIKEDFNTDVKDSKELTYSNIVNTAEELQNTGDKIVVKKNTPEQIDNCELLNKIITDNVIQIINTLHKNQDKLIIDTIMQKESTYKQRLLNNTTVPENLLTVEKQADKKYKPVSAASIIAKYHREESIQKIQNRHKNNIGSGYPSDERTVEFLREYYKKNNNFPPSTRNSWQTVKDIKQEFEQTSISDFNNS